MNDSLMLQYAFHYLSRGISVIPLKADKTPYASWKEYQTRRATEEEVREWFVKYPKANLGIVTGQISGLIIIDVDAGHGGLETMEWLDLPDTPKVRTGGGGFHFYYFPPTPEPISNFQAREELQGIDLRGDGGYVVAPPSIHESGYAYEWVNGFELDMLPLATLPEWAYSPAEEKKPPLNTLYAGVSNGNRNQTLARLAGSWIRDELPLVECIELAKVWNSRNQPPMGDREVETTVKSIYEKHFSHDIEVFDPAAILQWGRDLKKLDVRIDWIVDKVIPQDSVTLIVGRGGIGKSRLCLQMSTAISTGRDFMGHKVLKTPVYYIDFENALPILIGCIRAFGADDIQFWHTTNSTMVPPKLDSGAYELYKQLPPGIVFFDTLRASHMKDENESQGMALIMSRLKEIRDAGHTVVILHHTSKANLGAAKGSTVIADAADQVLSLSDVSKCLGCSGTGYTGFGRSGKVCPKCEGTGEIGSVRYLRLGTQGKTRYKPYQLFLTFDKEVGGFGPVKDAGILTKLMSQNKEL